MIEPIQILTDALRDELKQYGEMLALLDQQQVSVLERQTQDILQTVDAINVQSTAIQAARHAREQYQRNLARALGLADDAAFELMLPMLPAHYRPLLQALVEENNDLLRRIQQRARQNHLLLSRAVELMQRFMTGMFPAMGATTYNGDARLVEPAVAGRSVYEAVG